jgi:hypothetical protein
MKRAEESSALIGERTSSTSLEFRLGTAQRRPNCRARIGGARVEQGKLQLDQPVGNILPELSAPQVLEGFDDSGAPRLRPA